MDARTGRDLYSQNADTRLHPASLTKMMTLYLAFTAVERGQIRLDSKILISQHAANQPPSRLGLKPGQRIELRYLIRAAAVKSANDAATAIAEGLGGGSEQVFAQQMTSMARALGMRNSQFRNAHGLTTEGHFSSARDMSILGRRLFYDFPQYYNIFSRRSADAGIANVASTNKRFLDSYEGADGIKTGYTRAAGFNLTASAQRGNKRLIATVMGGQSTAHRNQIMAQLLDAGFGKAPTRVREIRPEPPQYMAETRVRRTQVARNETTRAPQNFRIAASARPAARSNSASLANLAPAQPAAPAAAAAPARGAALQASARPSRKPGHAPAVVATKSATDSAVALAMEARPEARPEEGDAASSAPGLSSSARPARRAGRVDEISSAADVQPADAASLFPQADAAAPEALTRTAAVAPARRADTIILASMAPDEQQEPQATEIVSRINGGSKNWGVNIGRYTSQKEAEQILLRTALQESATLDSALRRVANTNRGFEANFVGLTRASAELACDRLVARQMNCNILRP
ncbi:serine hydrolase [Paracoccus sp. DMF-8]|uniref:D-alanyl-D-alanine carboxypeptidase family protein n=1 Tax=Paracoccus sp. DMF-8 TaxID=3019445 RepID=UPI0023E8086B|nr:serine hydrolase [Paracoccus sp. DMF-8]MDF3605543.1 serine hydrolase [Paracoccus sp. DMF-8]